MTAYEKWDDVHCPDCGRNLGYVECWDHPRRGEIFRAVATAAIDGHDNGPTLWSHNDSTVVDHLLTHHYEFGHRGRCRR